LIEESYYERLQKRVISQNKVMNLDSGVMYAYDVRGGCSLASAALALVHDLYLNNLNMSLIIKYNE
jgi:hypothetical protein